MEQIRWKNENIKFRQALIDQFVAIIIIFSFMFGLLWAGAMLFVFIFENSVIMWYPLLLFVVSVILFTMQKKLSGFDQGENDTKSLTAKSGFNPSFVSSFSENYGFAFDCVSRELCVSERKWPNLYDVMYFGINELRYNIILERNVERDITKVKSASYGAKLAGGLVGGLPGTLVAGAVGAKYKKGGWVPYITKATLLIASLSDPGKKFEKELFNDFMGKEDGDLQKYSKNYADAIKLFGEIIKHADKKSSSNIRIITHDTTNQ